MSHTFNPSIRGREQRQVDLYESWVSLVYIQSSKPAKAT